jgi:hypothetical protein
MVGRKTDEEDRGMGKGVSKLRRGAFTLAILSQLLFGCAGFEKHVDLTYERLGTGKSLTGEVYLAKALVEQSFPRLPGGRIVLGSVKNSGMQIVTSDDVSRWIDSAVMEELYSAGFDVRTVSSIPEGALRSIRVRVVRLDSNQQSDGLLLLTSTEISLAADIWKKGRLLKTLTVDASSQEQGVDRSGKVVSASLRANLRTALEQLMPGILGAFRE